MGRLLHFLVVGIAINPFAFSLFLPYGRTGTGPVRTFIRVTDIFRSLIDHFGNITDLINYSDVNRTIFLSRALESLQHAFCTLAIVTCMLSFLFFFPCESGCLLPAVAAAEIKAMVRPINSPLLLMLPWQSV